MNEWQPGILHKSFQSKRNLLRNSLTCCEDVTAQCKLHHSFEWYFNTVKRYELYVVHSNTFLQWMQQIAITRNNQAPAQEQCWDSQVYICINAANFSLYLKIKKTKHRTLTGEDHEASCSVLIRYGQGVRMFMYLSSGTFSIQTTHNCTRKKFCCKEI